MAERRARPASPDETLQAERASTGRSMDAAVLPAVAGAIRPDPRVAHAAGTAPRLAVVRVADAGGRAAAAGPFEAFFQAEYPRLLRALYLVTGNRHEAEELAQDTFVRALER